MILLHRLNGQEVTLNTELVEWVEAQGVQTVIAMATGNKLIVTESVAEVIEKSMDYRKKVYAGGHFLPQILKLPKEGNTPC